jgi:hypothetical protein
MNLKREPATTAPRGSLHPFRSRQILNPYASYYRSPFAFSAFSYPLAQQLPSRVACHGQRSGVGGQLGLPRSRPCRPDCSVGPVRLAPVFPPVALLTTCFVGRSKQPATHLFGLGLTAALAQLSSRGLSTVHLCCACGTCLAPHTARRLAVSIPSPSPG